jgi:hypothetical protein
MSLEQQFNTLQSQTSDTFDLVSDTFDPAYFGSDSEDDIQTTVIYDDNCTPDIKLKELTDLQQIAGYPVQYNEPNIGEPDYGAVEHEGHPIKTYSVEIDNHPIAQCAIEAYATNGTFELSYKDIWLVFRSVLPLAYHARLDKIEQYSDRITYVNEHLSVIGSPEIYQELQDIIRRTINPPDKLNSEEIAGGITRTTAFYCYNVLLPIVTEIQHMIECSIDGTQYPNHQYKAAAIFYDNSPVAHCTSGWVFDLAPRRPTARLGTTDGNRLLIHSGLINDAIRDKPYSYSASFSASKAIYYYMSRTTIYKSGRTYRLMD